MTTPDLTRDEFHDKLDNLIKQAIRRHINEYTDDTEPNHLTTDRWEDAAADIDRFHDGTPFTDLATNYPASVEAYCTDSSPNHSGYERITTKASSGTFSDVINTARRQQLRNYAIERAETLVKDGEWDAVQVVEEPVTKTVEVGDTTKEVEGTQTKRVLDDAE